MRIEYATCVSSRRCSVGVQAFPVGDIFLSFAEKRINVALKFGEGRGVARFYIFRRHRVVLNRVWILSGPSMPTFGKTVESYIGYAARERTRRIRVFKMAAARVTRSRRAIVQVSSSWR